jgi:hypothetical protein
MATKLDNILIGKQYYAIEVFSANDVEKIGMISVKNTTDGLIIEESRIFEKPGFKIDKTERPTMLIINDKQVLHKQVNSTDRNDQKILQKAFPNLPDDKFYYEIWRLQEASIVALCRKEYIDALLASLSPFYNIAGITLGITSVSGLAQFTLPLSLNTNSYELDFASVENFITQQNRMQPPSQFNINDLDISNSQLLPFCGVLALVAGTNTTGTISHINLHAKEGFLQKSFFKKALTMMLSFLLLLLLLNFILFNYYFKKAAETEEKVASSNVSLQNYARLREQIKEKEHKVKGIADDMAAKSSYRINELVKDLPTSILLTELDYHPLAKGIKKDDPIQVETGTILISGSTINNIDFTKWVQKLEELKWIKDVIIVSFGKNEDNKTLFSIKIQCN